MFNREELAWAAGLFEGEGTICLSSDYNGVKGVKVGIGSHTDLDVLQKFQASIGNLGKIYGPYERKTKDGRPQKTCWKWEVNTFELAQTVVAALWPWLCSRRKAKALECFKAFHGREIRSSRHGRGTLAKHRNEILSLRASGETVSNIAQRFNVSRALISMACSGKR